MRASRARCWSSMPARASRRRRWPTSIRPSMQQPRDRPGPEQDRPAAAEPERVKENIEDVIGIDAHPTPSRSRPRPASISPTCWRPSSPAAAPPKGDRNAPLKAMLVDSWYDAYLGVVVAIRVIDGVVKKGDRIRMMQTERRLWHRQAASCARR